MGLTLGVLKETFSGECRVAIAPATVKKIIKHNIGVLVESGAGVAAGFRDQLYITAGAAIAKFPKDVCQCDIVFGILCPEVETIKLFKKGSFFISLMNPFNCATLLKAFAGQGVNVLGVELIPRTSRAQSMDVLSSQANIGGYKSVLDAVAHYGRFVPMMMTSAGMAKPARLCVLGVGVAGLQAIATGRRLGAIVEAFDVRSEVKEQIESLGAKAIELDLGEDGAGACGYAKALSEEAQKKQQHLLADRLKDFDIIISTANIPGRKAPVLILEEAVKQMNSGSVIVDMAAANGGNCPLSKAGEVIVAHDVTIIGETNYPSRMPGDASFFFGNNLVNVLALFLQKVNGDTVVQYDFEDDIIDAAVMVHDGKVRFESK